MFSGFASTTSPGVKVWDFTKSPATGTYRVALEDDCAAYHLFMTGSSTTSIFVQLPSNAFPGKTITIKNERLVASNQLLQVADSVSLSVSKTSFYNIGQGQAITFVCAPNHTNYNASSGTGPVQWLPIQMASFAPINVYASVLSGDSNQATAFAAVVAGGSTNTASGLYAAVGGGQSNTASAQYAAVGSGNSNTANNTQAFVGGGGINTASGASSVVAGGSNNTANGTQSAIMGGKQGNTRSISGFFAEPACDEPIATATGVSQGSRLILGRETTNATATILASNSGSITTTNQLTLPNNSAFYVKGSVVATVTGGGNSKVWDFTALIKRGANAAATSLVGTPSVTSPYADTGASGWTVALSADTTRGSLTVTVTGQAATTIRWVCKLESTEVTY